MSTFGGLIQEIPGISIDRFDGVNLDSQLYFLSHCHKDHMVGLRYYFERIKFTQQLVEKNKFLYLSHISCAILKNLYPEFKDTEVSKRLLELDLNSSTIIEIDENQMINCTPIPAGHCPGSVMFLFETKKPKKHTILYTGDYRIKPTDLCKFKAFYDSSNQLRTIDKIHLDTTFFLKSYKAFPPRDDSVAKICSLIKEWLQKSDKNVVNLSTGAKYGYEFLFMEIYEKFKYPVHVNDENYNFYCKVLEMDNCVTRDGAITPIHSSCINHYNICIKDQEYLRKIRITAWTWTTDTLSNGDIYTTDNKNEFGVCYSTHASYDEGVGLIKLLKPKAIEANVLPEPERNREIQRNIKEQLKMIHNIDESNCETDSDSDDESLLLP